MNSCNDESLQWTPARLVLKTPPRIQAEKREIKEQTRICWGNFMSVAQELHLSYISKNWVWGWKRWWDSAGSPGLLQMQLMSHTKVKVDLGTVTQTIHVPKSWLGRGDTLIRKAEVQFPTRRRLWWESSCEKCTVTQSCGEDRLLVKWNWTVHLELILLRNSTKNNKTDCRKAR